MQMFGHVIMQAYVLSRNHASICFTTSAIIVLAWYVTFESTVHKYILLMAVFAKA